MSSTVERSTTDRGRAAAVRVALVRAVAEPLDDRRARRAAPTRCRPGAGRPARRAARIVTGTWDHPSSCSCTRRRTCTGASTPGARSTPREVTTTPSSVRRRRRPPGSQTQRSSPWWVIHRSRLPRKPRIQPCFGGRRCRSARGTPSETTRPSRHPSARSTDPTGGRSDAAGRTRRRATPGRDRRHGLPAPTPSPCAGSSCTSRCASAPAGTRGTRRGDDSTTDPGAPRRERSSTPRSTTSPSTRSCQVARRSDKSVNHRRLCTRRRRRRSSAHSTEAGRPRWCTSRIAGCGSRSADTSPSQMKFASLRCVAEVTAVPPRDPSTRTVADVAVTEEPVLEPLPDEPSLQAVGRLDGASQ